MTKTVRIENADSGTDKKIIVEVWQNGRYNQDGGLVKTIELKNPTDLATEVVYQGVFIVIREETQ